MVFSERALRRRIIKNGLLLSAICIFTNSLATDALAADAHGQAPEPQAGTTVASSDQLPTQALQEIIVTAQRRSENLQKTAVAVTAFSTRDLEEKQIRSVRDLVAFTPNLQVLRTANSSPNFVQFSIRGFAISRPLIGVQQPVGVYVDDFFYPSLNGALLRVLDLQSVEILRGPQGTLFGQNSLDGAVRYNTIAPSLDHFNGHVDSTMGERNRRDFTGAVNIPLGEMAAVRVSGGSLHQDGYVTDTTTGKPVGNTQGTIGRVQLRFKPTNNFTADLTAEYIKSHQDGDPEVVVQIVNPGQSFSDPLAVIAGRAPDPINPPFLNSPGVVSPDGKSVIYQGTYVPNFNPAYNSSYQASCRYCASGTTAPEFANTVTKDARATIAWSPGTALTIKSLTSYFDITNSSYIDLDHTPVNDSQSTDRSHETAFSQELQAGGALMEDRLTYVAGLYYYHYTDNDNLLTFGDAPPTLAISSVKRSSYAAYAQVNFKLTSNLTATVGGRETHEHVAVTSSTNGTLVVPPPASFNGFTPTFKLQYQVVPEIMAYASIAKGFRGGTINTVDPSVYPQVPVKYGLAPVQPDTAWSYEGGIRSQFFNRHLQINATYFYSKIKNIQELLAYAPVCQPFVPCLPVPQSVLANVGSAEFNGLELETQAVFGHLRLHGNLSTLHSRYTSIDASAIVADLTTNSRFEHAPKLTYSLGAAYRLPVNKGAIEANLDYGWQGEQVAGNQDHVSALIPSYGVLNGRIAFDVTKNFTFALSVSNLTNKFYLLNNNNNLFYIGIRYYEPGEPRTVAASAQVRF